MNHLRTIRSWAAVFGPALFGELEAFDLVVMPRARGAHPRTMQWQLVDDLQNRGVLVVAHVSAADADAADEAELAAADGFDGVYLDDVAGRPGHPPLHPVGRLVSAVRFAVPHALVIVQDVGPELDGLAYDALGSRSSLRDAPRRVAELGRFSVPAPHRLPAARLPAARPPAAVRA